MSKALRRGGAHHEAGPRWYAAPDFCGGARDHDGYIGFEFAS